MSGQQKFGRELVRHAANGDTKITRPRTLNEAYEILARPFTAGAIKVKPLTKAGQDGKAMAAFYVDSRMVAERLTAVVGADGWSDEYKILADGPALPLLYYPVECALTVWGVAKRDVGQGPSTAIDEKAWKSAYSDAFKRAAVKFGVGQYLYAIPQCRAEVKLGNNGKVLGFTPGGRTVLIQAYERWLNTPLNRWGDPLDHGSILDDADALNADGDDDAQPARTGAPADMTAGGGAASTPSSSAATPQPSGQEQPGLAAEIRALPELEKANLRALCEVAGVAATPKALVARYGDQADSVEELLALLRHDAGEDADSGEDDEEIGEDEFLQGLAGDEETVTGEIVNDDDAQASFFTPPTGPRGSAQHRDPTDGEVS